VAEQEEMERWRWRDGDGGAGGDVQARFILQIEITRNKKRGNVGR